VINRNFKLHTEISISLHSKLKITIRKITKDKSHINFRINHPSSKYLNNKKIKGKKKKRADKIASKLISIIILMKLGKTKT